MGEIKYLIGDATAPQSENGQGIICHVCNDEKKWGSGFVISVSKRWPQPEAEYRRMTINDMKVGNFQLVVVGNNLIVANIIGQSGLRFRRSGFGVPAVDYAAIETALSKIAGVAKSMNLDLHMPRIGSFRSGGNWEVMEVIIKRAIRDKCNAYVYDLENNNENYIK
jgi:hypothetical protein